ncbi:G-protein coupled receptor family C group 6 member A-like [Astyanax mexicanus]|uniref:G-protein coupled receptor family C group 6 member A-like n=1 Tax=Astyanax mexicanus TaxID=7994 RepID=UPI0020CB07E1|nr:G-protein coupled receptor family C group 6 member A-like [Astyanax mexicanus]
MLLWLYIVISGTVLWVDFGTGCDYSVNKCGAWSDGDVQIGVLSSCFSKVENVGYREQPDAYNCSGFSVGTLVRMLAIIHTIDTINNSSFLPGVRLGYYICDTCSDASRAIQSTEHMLATNGSWFGQCALNQMPRVKVIIGPRYSEVALIVARLLALYMVPQISTSASAEALSDRQRFPAFLRTVPSDIHQTKALAKLMSHFKWDWVGVVYGDDDYGQNAFQGFVADAQVENVCVAFKERLPYNLNSMDIDTKIRELANKIRNSSAKVVLLILKEELVRKLFDKMIQQNISRTWIASDSWSMSQETAQMDGINQVGNILGFSFITGPNPGFEEYLQDLSIPPGAENKFIEQYKQMGASKDYLTTTVNIRTAYGERMAVLSIAHALKKLLKCNETACAGDTNFPPWMLLKELKNIRFTLEDQTFYYDKLGSFNSGYDLINWERNMSNGQRQFDVIGHYSNETIQINPGKPLDWGNTNNTIPVSTCSKACQAGTAKQLSKTSCCYNCTECLEGTYSNMTNALNCLPCENGTWSLKGSTNCSAKREVYWEWTGAQAIVLLTFSLIGFLFLFINLIIYCVYRGSPVINQAGGYICIPIMVGLALSYVSVILFIGKPDLHICMARQVLYALGFALTISCILVKALRTFLAFLPQYGQPRVKKVYHPPVLITCGTLLQVLICVFSLIYDPPSVKPETNNQTMEIMFQCKEGSGKGFPSMLVYNALLALICFALAFKGRKVPQRFNETGHIILSMLIYLFVWVCFIPVYAANIPERYSIQAAAILVSTFGIIFCHFTPKWYMALCKKKEEVTVEAYIARACNNRFSVDSGMSNTSGTPESLRSKTGSQTTMNSNDTGVCSTECRVFVLNVENSSNKHPTMRRRLRRRSI